MRPLHLLIFLAVTVAMPVSFAQSQDQDHSAHHPAPAKEPAAAPPAEHEHGAAKADPLQENMSKIEAVMRQLQQESDANQKRELLSQHLQALREQMRLIRSEHRPMKMSMNEDGKKDDAAKEGAMKKGVMMGGGMMMMHQKVEQRLDMLERLLQQVIEREAVEAGQ